MKKRDNYKALSDINLLRAYVFNPKELAIVEELKRRNLISDAKRIREVTSLFVQEEAKLVLNLNNKRSYSLNYAEER
jgi:hypothetical protein